LIYAIRLAKGRVAELCLAGTAEGVNLHAPKK
jgi:hypothetical protein